MKSSTFDTISCLLGEFLATAMLLFLGCMGCTGHNNGLLQMALNFGFAVMLIIQCFGCVSGAHLNPVITLAAYIMDMMNLRLALAYVCAQLLGSFAGYSLLMYLVPKSFLPLESEINGFCVTIPHSEFSFEQAVVIEFVITSTLILFACSIWDPRNEKDRETLSLKFCLAVVCLGLTALCIESKTYLAKLKEESKKENMKSSTFDIVTPLLAEFLGTTLLVFLACLGCAGENSLLKIALNVGFTVMLIVQTLGCVSGAHLSPAITLAAYIMDQISLLLSVGYFCAQLLGCYTGYALLMFLIPSTFLPTGKNDDGFCLTLPHPELGYMQAVAIEFIITATLVFFACSFWDPRNAKYGKTIPIKFGFAIICMACTAGNFTGASMNPARSLAPALWNNNFKYQGVYWIGPLSAAVVSSYMYKLVFWRDVKEN